MAKKDPGLLTNFKGLWVRDFEDGCPPDHFQDTLNTVFATSGVGTRDGLSEYIAKAGIKRMALYKPLPPFAGTNVPRIIALDSSGQLFDLLLSTSTPIYTNALMTSFGFVNFFGRCYFSPSNGKTGLDGVKIQLYDGTAVRDAAGAPPTTPLTVTWDTVLPGITDVGTVLFSYSFETSSGFITRPATPFVGMDSFGSGQFHVTNLPLGPAGTVARWIICTKYFDLATIGPLGGPYKVELAEFVPLYFALRVADNISITADLNFLDEGLIEDASFLYTQLTTIPAGVGLLDYKGRMVSYGEYTNPSLTRVSEIGEPEAFSETSGFIITDPSDSTGVRCATEFRNILYLYKGNRGYMTQDNTLEASTWEVVNFEKSVGTSQDGIAAVLDAKGSSSDGFIIASRGAVYYFNGVIVEPELSYKIRDLWLRRSEEYEHLTQVSLDPINKRIYILVALDNSTEISHIIYGDYRDGLNPMSIKWSLWAIAGGSHCILTYTDLTDDTPTLVTRVTNDDKVLNLNIDIPSSDDGIATDSYVELADVRFTPGLSQFNRFRLRGKGPCNLTFTAFGMDKTLSVTPAVLNIPSSTPGREYAQLMNLVSELCSLKIRCNVLNENYKINMVKLEGLPYADERPR